MKVIDLFAGCGGFSVGFLKSNYEIVGAVEFDSVIANTYKQNHPNVRMYVDDIKNVDESKIFKKNEADVIIGGPPCQGFSMAGARIRNGFMDDPRNYLFRHYFNIVKSVKPKAFVIENVKGILTMQQGKIFKEILNIFSDASNFDGKPYNLFYKVVKAVEFGIPQKRERVVIIGLQQKNVEIEKIWEETKIDIKHIYPTYFDNVTVDEAIGNMPAISQNGVVNNPVPKSSYEEYLASKDDFIKNHNESHHSEKAIQRMKKIKCDENFTVLNEKINSVHSGAYGRLNSEKPAQTITTRFDTPAGGRFIHPREDRTITPREAARLQSFPDDFVFYGTRTSICKQIGNAVPPKISFFLAKLIQNILEK